MVKHAAKEAVKKWLLRAFRRAATPDTECAMRPREEARGARRTPHWRLRGTYLKRVSRRVEPSHEE
jgi:hypothetical protein